MTGVARPGIPPNGSFAVINVAFRIQPPEFTARSPRTPLKRLSALFRLNYGWSATGLWPIPFLGTG